jgi:tetratricopeptide (TPR) repeat protein
VEDGFYLWSEQYIRVLEDIFAIQDEITFSIIDKLKVHLLKKERSTIKKFHTKNRDAFSWYLKGIYFRKDRTAEGMKKGIECFEKAIEIEPEYALAYAGIADAYCMLGGYYYLPAKESYPKALEAARKAIELDNSLAEAHCVLGFATLKYNWNWEVAEKSFLIGLKINPGYFWGHETYSRFLLMLARFDEAHREILLARELNPLGLITNANVGYSYFLRGKYDAALKEYNKALEIDPNFYPLLRYIAETYEQKGLLDKALEKMKQAYNKSEMNLNFLSQLGHTYALSGNKKEALKILEQLKVRSEREFVSASNFAIIFLGLNEVDETIHWLEKSYEEKAPFISYLKVDPRLDKVRTDQRFIDLIKKVGLN